MLDYSGFFTLKQEPNSNLTGVFDYMNAEMAFFKKRSSQSLEKLRFMILPWKIDFYLLIIFKKKYN